MDDRRALSRRLYRVLEDVGGSEELRQLHRETATAIEVAETVSGTLLSPGFMTNRYLCGSSFEGTVTPDLTSDRDIIDCCGLIPVVHDVRAAPRLPSFLAVRDSYTHPGYVKLQLVVDGQPLTARHGLPSQLMNGKLDNGELDSKERVCIKHMTLFNMNGPANKFLNENGEHFLDGVPAFRCDTIPPFANEWFQQQRPSDRPSQEQVHTMSRMGCLFVGAGHVNSKEKDIEWRLSFSLQERFLMSNLNPVQHKVYLLLKLIKKNILVPFFNDKTLTSYHFKTCVLCTVKITPARAWTNDNLISCFLQCMKVMVKWLERTHCPNYFVHDQNLFSGFSRSLVRHLLHVVRRIVETDTLFVSMLQSDNIGEIMTHGDCRRYRELSVLKTNEFTAYLKIYCAKYIKSVTMRVLNTQIHEPFSLASTLNILQRTESINWHTTEATQSSLAYLYLGLHLHIAKDLASLTYRYPDAGNHQQLMEMADFHFNEARGADLVNERLARATLMYKAGQFEECFLLLQQVENNFICHVTLICPCTATVSQLAYNKRDKHILYRKLAELPLRQVIRSMTASCVVFLPSQQEITPDPLQQEMRRSEGTPPGSRFQIFHYWFDWAAVDPRVFLHFMQYLVSSRLNKEPYKQVALDNLKAEIATHDHRVRNVGRGHLSHKDTAYNLLGWIHAQEGRPADARRCFSESWKIRPYHNAAKFHMQDLC